MKIPPHATNFRIPPPTPPPPPSYAENRRMMGISAPRQNAWRGSVLARTGFALPRSAIIVGCVDWCHSTKMRRHIAVGAMNCDAVKARMLGPGRAARIGIDISSIADDQRRVGCSLTANWF